MFIAYYNAIVSMVCKARHPVFSIYNDMQFSLVDAAGGSIHKYHPVEQDANIRAYQYFMKKIPGFNMKNIVSIYENGKWDNYKNSIHGYNWNLGYNDTTNQAVLKKDLFM